VMKSEIEQHSGFVFALMLDSGAYSGLSDPTAKVIADINYAAQTYFGSPNYMLLNGSPVLFPFGLETLPIDWTRVMAGIQGSPVFIFRNLVGFSYADSSGGYAWGPDQPLGYWDYFYPNAIPLNKPTYGSVSKGFNDSLAAWRQTSTIQHRSLCRTCRSSPGMIMRKAPPQRWESTTAPAFPPKLKASN